jgi:hypothetical protein
VNIDQILSKLKEQQPELYRRIEDKVRSLGLIEPNQKLEDLNLNPVLGSMLESLVTLYSINHNAADMSGKPVPNQSKGVVMNMNNQEQQRLKEINEIAAKLPPQIVEAARNDKSITAAQLAHQHLKGVAHTVDVIAAALNKNRR